MLISTMITLVLIIGVVTMLQAAGLANAKLLKKAAYVQREDMARRAVRELARPLAGEALSREEAEAGFEAEAVAVGFDDVEFKFEVRKEAERNLLELIIQ